MKIIESEGLRLNRWPNRENPQPLLQPRVDVNWEAGGVYNPSVVRGVDGNFHMV